MWWIHRHSTGFLLTYNTVEELERVTRDSVIEHAAMSEYECIDNRTLEVTVREDNFFRDGERVTPVSVKRSIDEQMRWQVPHLPGTHFNPPAHTVCVISGEQKVRFLLPEPDGLLLGKLQATHIMGTRFWHEVGFGYARNGTGEGSGE
jgi:hypothetical protein